jgi:hypothetical protein
VFPSAQHLESSRTVVPSAKSASRRGNFRQAIGSSLSLARRETSFDISLSEQTTMFQSSQHRKPRDRTFLLDLNKVQLYLLVLWPFSNTGFRRSVDYATTPVPSSS